jgi:hypothetical protein
VTVLARDVSNYTDELTPEVLAKWKTEGVELVIIQAVDPPIGYPVGKTRTQIQQCLDAGLAVDAYIYLWFDAAIADVQKKLALLNGFPIRQVWLDVEDTAAARYNQATTEARVAEALGECDRFPTTFRRPTGIYSGPWFWTDARYMANTTAFSERVLWDSDYDGVPDTEAGWTPYGGWLSRAIKQYAGSQPDGTDLNVLCAEEAAALEGGDTPVSDDPAWVAKKADVVAKAGELQTVADQLAAEANRKNGPRRAQVLALASGVRDRADEILA